MHTAPTLPTVLICDFECWLRLEIVFPHTLGTLECTASGGISRTAYQRYSQHDDEDAATLEADIAVPSPGAALSPLWYSSMSAAAAAAAEVGCVREQSITLLCSGFRHHIACMHFMLPLAAAGAKLRQVLWL
jgi:hypothetical protein